MTGLHHDAVVVDCHNDFILVVDRRARLGDPDHFASYWLPELRRGGVDVQVVPLYVSGEHLPEGALRRTLQLLERLHRLAEAHPGDVALCATGAEIDEAVSSGRIALVAALEGCDAIGTDVELFATYFRLGVRMASFTHFGRSPLADGSAEDDTGSRLTRAGVAAVAELERLGIVVDVSHLSIAGAEHVLELATRPLVASHSSARAQHDHHRNLSDELLRGIAATGGVIGVNFFPGFVDPERPTIDRLADHIEHVAEVAGIDHVGLGPDFLREYVADVYAGHPDLRIEGLRVGDSIEGAAYAHDLPNVTETLLGRGFPDDDVRKVLGENFLRVFREVMGRPG